MHNCDCALTSMDPLLMPNLVPANPADASLYVAVGETVTTNIYLYDSISLVCGDGTGLTYCGASRSVTFLNGGVVDNSILTFDSANSELSVTGVYADIGTYFFEVKIAVDSVAGSEFTIQSAYQVEIYDACTLTAMSAFTFTIAQ